MIDPTNTESVPNESLKVGDMVDALGWKRIVAIRPYRGPFDFILGIVDTDAGCGFSLERGGYTLRVRK
jgi:hypothetical protein